MSTTSTHVKDAAAAELANLGEEELALWQRRCGAEVSEKGGRWWSEVARGFYQPVSPLSRFTYEDATPPAGLRWGSRAVLRDEDASRATGTFPIHLMTTQLADFDLETLGSKRRSDVRKCRKLVQLVELTAPDLLLEQGHAVTMSSIARTGYSAAPTPEKFAADVKAYFNPGRVMVLAGIVDGKLGGYFTGYCVDGIAYIDRVYIATEVLRTSIGSGLLFEFIQACRRSGRVREIFYGQDTPEDKPLVDFKAAFGFPSVHRPARVEVNPFAGAAIRWLLPKKAYRLMGRR